MSENTIIDHVYRKTEFFNSPFIKLFNLSLAGRSQVFNMVNKCFLHLGRIIHTMNFSLSVAFLLS